jgi:hypothetical protein
MERDVDLSSRQILAWLRRDAARGDRRQLAWRATREFVVEPASGPGIDADDGLDTGCTIGLLEVGPRRGSQRWTLRLRIEDELGAHLPDDGSVPDDPEPMDLAGFEAAFLPAGAEPPADVGLEADTATARRHFRRLVAMAYAAPGLKSG